MSTVRLRLISTSLAAALTAATVYLAVTQRFPIIADLIDEWAPIAVIKEKQPPAEPLPKVLTPPVRELTAHRETTAETDAAPVEEVIPTAPAVETAPIVPKIITDPRWIERPSGRDYVRFYPDRALERGRGGRVVLDCVVAASGRIGCSVMSEEPAGWGFGEAAIRISQSFRMSPRLENGEATEGGRVRVPINFRLD